MSEIPAHAVFLSYASEDTVAALRLCTALRAAGVVVWFDQSDLTGGDQWDGKIRGQIATCTLFIPVISAATQARLEGYFRIEWKLAAQRTHAMAEAKAFLLPVVIDATRDADAHVPPEFKSVQWTRLPAGETSAAFCSLVNSLLASSTVPRAFQPVIPTPTVRNTRPWLVPTLATLTVAIVALALWQPWKKPPPASPVAASASEPKPTPAEPSAQATAPLSPAQKLIAQARTLYEPWDLATPDDFKLAEKLLRNAIELEPANSEAWTHLALVSCGMARMNIDRTTARIAEARKQADYAVKLTPNSDYAQFAVAFAMRLDGPASVQAESIRLLRGLAVRQPHDKFILRILGYTILFNNPSAEEERDGLEFLARAAALPGGDPVAEYSRGQYLYFHSTTRLPEAIAAFDRAIALAPLFPRAHIYKIRILLFKYADSEAARQALDQVPAAILRDDQMAVLAALTLFAVNQSDRVINALQPAGPYVTTVLFRGPTAYYKGLAHRRAGRLSAAQTEWNVALQVIQRRLDADPTAATDVLWKARLLALLEQRTEAHATFELYQQLAASSGRTKHDLEIQILLRPPNEALQSLTELLTDKDKFKSLDAAGRVLFDPALDPLRPAPGFAALAAQAKAIFAELNKPAPEQKN